MEVWTGKPVDYYNLIFFEALALVYIMQDKLYVRAMKYVFIGYVKGEKEYKKWKMEPRWSKFIIFNYVNFD